MYLVDYTYENVGSKEHSVKKIHTKKEHQGQGEINYRNSKQLLLLGTEGWPAYPVDHTPAAPQESPGPGRS